MRITNLEALKAQASLAKLMEMDLPIKTSLDIALVSKLVDEQVAIFSKVRDNLFKKNSIKIEKGEVEGQIQFISTVKGETEEETIKLQKEALESFSEKFNSLLDAKTEDLVFSKVKLPKEVDGKSLQIKPEILRGLIGFVETE